MSRINHRHSRARGPVHGTGLTTARSSDRGPPGADPREEDAGTGAKTPTDRPTLEGCYERRRETVRRNPSIFFRKRRPRSPGKTPVPVTTLPGRGLRQTHRKRPGHPLASSGATKSPGAAAWWAPHAGDCRQRGPSGRGQGVRPVPPGGTAGASARPETPGVRPSGRSRSSPGRDGRVSVPSRSAGPPAGWWPPPPVYAM